MHMKTIIITGSVGTGKTTLARKLCRKTGFAYGDANLIIAKHKLNKNYDKKKGCFVVDEQRLATALLAEISSARKKKEKGIIFDSHMAQCLPKKAVDLCIVTTCEISELAKRLKRRGYPAAKIRENVQCEIFQVCLEDATEKKYKIIVQDTTAPFKI